MRVYIVMARIPYEGSWVQNVHQFESDANRAARKLNNEESPYGPEYYVEGWDVN